MDDHYPVPEWLAWRLRFCCYTLHLKCAQVGECQNRQGCHRSSAIVGSLWRDKFICADKQKTAQQRAPCIPRCIPLKHAAQDYQ